jgi:hypothetical protein
VSSHCCGHFHNRRRFSMMCMCFVIGSFCCK